MKKTQRCIFGKFSAVEGVLFVGIVALSVAILCLASVPPVSRDALTHHLAVPKLYLQHGGIYEIPNLNFSYYPMNLDLLYIVPLAYGNDIVPKYIHFIFALLTAWLIFRYLHHKCGRSWGILSSLLFLSIPIIIKLSTTVYVDLGLIFFTTASLLLLFRWAEQGYKLRDLLFSSACCGLAIGTKYNGLISLFLLSCFTPILYARSTNDDQPSNLAMIRHGSLFALIALATASPWLIRNFLWTGNPFFPLFQNIFHLGLQQEGTGGLDIFTTRHLVFGETPLQILLLPLRIFFEGQDNNPQYFDGKLNPFLLFLPFFAFTGQEKSLILRLEKKFMLAFCILLLLFALFQSGMRIRYISPIIPFLVILSILGLQNIFNITSRYFRSTWSIPTYIPFLLLAILILSYNFGYLAKQFNYVQPIDYISGKIDRDEYITRHRPEYPVIQYANRQKDQKTLCLFLGNRGYYMEFPHVFDVPTSRNSLFTHLVSKTHNTDYIQRNLLKMGYQRILLRNDLTETWINNLKEQKEITAFFFQNNLELMYTANGYALFGIKPSSQGYSERTQ